MSIQADKPSKDPYLGNIRPTDRSEGKKFKKGDSVMPHYSAGGVFIGLVYTFKNYVSSRSKSTITGNILDCEIDSPTQSGLIWSSDNLSLIGDVSIIPAIICPMCGVIMLISTDYICTKCRKELDG